MRLDRALNIADLRVMAKRRLPAAVFDYADRGAEDELTLRDNRAAFERSRFLPRTLIDVSQRRQSITLFGSVFKSPFGIAPTGAAGLLRRDAEIALARAAQRAGIPFTTSTHAFVGPQRIAAESGSAPWFQLYMPRDRSAAEGIVDRARRAGCDTLVLTTDVPVGGKREYNDRNGFALPLAIGRRVMVDALRHPAWMLDVLGGGALRLGRLPALEEWSTRRDSQCWNDVRWLRDAWPGRLVIKGILRDADARIAVAHGVDALWVSNHGGRQLDCAVATLDALPHVVAAARGVPVFLDGGIRRGADIVKALALGARMAFVGRAALYGVAAGGEAGVTRALEILRDEVDRVLALLGCCSVDELEPGMLDSRQWHADPGRSSGQSREAM